MEGAIIGDIIGSVYEVNNPGTVDFDLFTASSHVSDDSVLTVAVADALMNDQSFFNRYRYWGRAFPDAGYGKFFKEWLFSDTDDQGKSFGNGAAMRVSPVAWLCQSLEEVLTVAKQSALPTHHHPEAIKGAQAIAAAIFMARQKRSKPEIKQYIETQFGYTLDKDIAWLRAHYQFDSTAPGSVPEAIFIFLVSNHYEETIRNAISIGGDTDTIACMAGGIAEAYYGPVPDPIRQEALRRVPVSMLAVLQQFQLRVFPTMFGKSM
ncbi:MAG: ADP-ribosylglycohydrolase family protein [Cyclobacteriaceae bacterium]|jgi:ADP-ribosylglycohydrolase|nr:ADP-ribosylglycohydrolase family protein [Cyclobacteriaceae bacterium]